MRLADEDAGEKLRHFKNRIPGELILLTDLFRGQDERGDDAEDEKRIAGHTLTGERHAEERDGETGLPDAGKQHRADHHCEDHEVDVRPAGAMFFCAPA